MEKVVAAELFQVNIWPLTLKAVLSWLVSASAMVSGTV